LLIHRFNWLAVALLLACGVAFAAEPAASEPEPAPAEPGTLRELIDASVKWYDVYASADDASADDGEPAEARVALRWANNSRGSEDGITILYVAAGRPVAATCVYPWAGRLEHDFESLSRGTIVAKKDGAVVWQPKQAGVSFAPVPAADEPDAKPAGRLRQMKKLAGRFQATMLGWKVDNTDREELRLLTKPLYRYEVQDGAVLDGGVLDGAVFAFAMGTDPEVLLLLEAVEQGGKSSWQYACARRTSGMLEARLDENVVWEADRFPTQHDSRLPHFTLGTPLPPEIAAAEKIREGIQP